MYLLDTNVVSELRKLRSGKIDANVAEWSRSVHGSELYISVITIFEMRLGLLFLERRDREQAALLRTWLDDVIMTSFDTRILAFTTEVATTCAGLNVPDRRPLSDAMIAATALTHGLIFVTRNVGDFAGTGVDVFNPWRR